MSKYGRQPAADLILNSGLTRVEIAKKLDVKITILNNTLAGAQIPSKDIVDGLAQLFSCAPSDLFTDEPLAREHGKRYKWAAMVSRGDNARIEQPTKRKGYHSD